MSESVELLKKIVALKPGGEVRTQQETAVSEIEDAIKTDTNLLLEAPTGSGKALDIQTPILTTTGWKKMGDLQVGDLVYNEDGKPTQITNVLDQFTSERAYAVEFSNGAEIITDSDHLWSVRAVKGEEVDPVNVSRLQEVKNKTLNIKSADSSNITDVRELAKAISYPMEAVEAAAAEVEPLEETNDSCLYDSDTFLEGMYKHFLGSSITRTTEELFAGTVDPTTLEPLWGILSPDALDFDNQVKLPTSSRTFGEWLAGKEHTFTPEQYEEVLAAGIGSNQNIPEIYLQASISNRKQLLTGLLGGELTGNFTTTVANLATDVRVLATSLGLHAVELSEFNDDNVLQVTIAISEQKYIYIMNIREVKPRLVRCITVDSPSHLYLAGKSLIPTHNTLSYLIPLVETGVQAVVSTATKQLSEQIYESDIPFVRKALKQTGSTHKLEAALLKGRDNYLCLAKMEEMVRLEDQANSLFATEELIETSSSNEAKAFGQEGLKIIGWAENTKTGDRSEAPAVGDEIWRQYSATNAECPGRNTCPFGDICFSEMARDRAKSAQIVVTNHAIVAQDLASEGKLLGDREVFVFDELHELDNYLSSAWGAELSSKRLRDAHKLFKTQASLTESAIKDISTCAEQFPTVLRGMQEGLIDNEDVPRSLGTMLTTLYNATSRISQDAGRELKQADGEAMKKLLSGIKKIADELNEVAVNLNNDSIENVRWVIDKTNVWKPTPKRNPKSRKPAPVEPVIAAEDARTLHAAPLRIGPKLQGFLDERDAIMIGTSATITVGRKFEIPLHNFGLDNKKNKTVELDSPFDYKKQAMFYVPKPGTFPEPTGQDRREHTEAVKKETAEFANAAGGRTLALSTTSSGAQNMAEAIRASKPKFTVLAQGDAPNAQLVKQFRDEETTTLAGTMGFWHGLDAPGKTLSLVIIDKLPFMRFDDPLAMARRDYADRMGRNGFMDVFVSQAETMFRQAFGRAIRSRTDLAVVVAFEPRLLSKPYGLGILNNLHGVGIYHDKQKVLEALRRLAAK